MPSGITHSDFWLGTEAGLRTLIELSNRADAAAFSSAQPAAFGDEDRPYELINGVAVIEVNGPIRSRASFWSRLFGMASYDQIQESLVAAARDPEVGAILMNYDSPGGVASGAPGTAEQISKIDKVKPVVSYTGNNAMSAALWLAVAGRKFFASDMAEVGSIGTIMTHVDVSKANEKDGLKVITIKSGEFKDLGNPNEPLSEKAQAELQRKVDYMADKFINFVAERRGKGPLEAKRLWGDANTYFSEQATKEGLIDGIKTADEVLAYAQGLAEKRLEKRGNPVNGFTHAQGNSMKIGAKTVVTAQDLAALAEGAGLEDEDQPGQSEPAPEASAQPEQTEQPAQPEVVSESAVVKMLREQLAEKDAQVVSLQLRSSKAEDSIAGLQASVDGFQAIARNSVRNMLVALGEGHGHLDTLSASALLTEHEKVSAKFKEKFKAGRASVSGVVAAERNEAAEVQETPDIFRQAGLSVNRRYIK